MVIGKFEITESDEEDKINGDLEKVEKEFYDLGHLKRVRKEDADMVRVIMSEKRWFDRILKSEQEHTTVNNENEDEISEGAIGTKLEEDYGLLQTEKIKSPCKIKGLQLLLEEVLGEKEVIDVSKNYSKIITDFEVPEFAIEVKSVYNKFKDLWSMMFKQGSIKEIETTQDELSILDTVVNKMISKLKEIPIEEDEGDGYNSFGILYNPNTKTICCEPSFDDEWTPINHPIMNVFKAHGEHLVEQSKFENEDDPIIHGGEKRGPKDRIEEKILSDDNQEEYDSNYHHQYFAKDLWLITTKNPCYMGEMAGVHSRISRLYFLDLENNYIQNEIEYRYKLNHCYEVFKINISSQ